MRPLAPVLADIKKLKIFQSILAELTGTGVVSVKAPGAFRPALAGAVFAESGQPLAIVCRTLAAAERFVLDVRDYLGEKQVVFLPDWESYPHEPASPDVETIGRRAEIMAMLMTGKPLVVGLAVSTLLQKVPGPEVGAYRGIRLTVGQRTDMHALAADLSELGYTRLPVVERPGEFAARGSVLDIFPAQALQPARLDFFGDELESIKEFEVGSQRSVGAVDAVEIGVCREFRLGPPAIEKLTAAGVLPVKRGEIHRWLPVIHKLVPITRYFPPGTIWLVDEPKAVLDEATDFFAGQSRTLSEVKGEEEGFTASDYYLTPDQAWAEMSPLINVGVIGPDRALEAEVGRPREVAGRFDRLTGELRRLNEGRYKTIIISADDGERRRLGELLSNEGIVFDPQGKVVPAAPALVVGETAHGFTLPDIGWAVYGRHDVFPRRQIETQVRVRPRRQSLVDFSDLRHGELLVHEVHGIAVFAGLVKKTVAGKTREYLMLDYAAGDRLYLPTGQLNRVSRYTAPEGIRPEVSRLGGTEWLRTTKKVRNSIKKLAVDLLALYAERAESPGYAFAPDTEWQRELEAAFPYEPTRDQAIAITEVKKDMEAVVPMDRLICGDVGYGKTEVALRAAFKAILDGKQVMLVVPTTILAQQHYLTFKERFAPYPVKVEMLSRFLSPGEQRDVVARLKTGVVDMAIGTHRLLQKDAGFKDLGLVIVDEEQRFGVNHKEKLRTLRRAVDVLTLSATPIPRTLQMSMSGIRDLSLIETPPEGRHSILTFIGEYQPAVIRAAVARELARGGQVFYVHNRVETIERVAVELKELAPEARIIVGHGQMSETQLEKVMLKFLDGRADILVCTTIIESGIDIPSANTLIINDADRLGLAQLYQLRGRVGRGHHRGYAYFTYRPGRALTETAIERLKTIGEFTELGSGYKVALRDLEIRGAGNILGAEQHGHVISVGFDLYCQMLRREIDHLRGKTEIPVPEVQIELPISAYLPQEYIDSENLRLEVYRSIASAVNEPELQSVADELCDRFGPLPRPVSDLLAVAGLRMTCAQVGITALSRQKERLIIKGLKHVADSARGDYDLIVKAKSAEIVIKVPPREADIVEFVLGFINAIMP